MTARPIAAAAPHRTRPWPAASLGLLTLTLLAGCRPAPPAAAPDAAPAPLVFERPDGRALYDGLAQPLPEAPAARDAACLARLAQARMLSAEKAQPVLDRAREARVTCRTHLAESWIRKADEIPNPTARKEACLNATAQLKALRKDDAPAAQRLTAWANRACLAAP